MKLSLTGGAEAPSGAAGAPQRAGTSVLRLLRAGARGHVAVLAVLVALGVAATAYVLGTTQPQVERTTALTRALRLHHEGMLDQETGLRAWIATGDRRFLESYESGRAASAAQAAVLPRLAAEDGLSTPVARALAAARGWEGAWVPAALTWGERHPTAGIADTWGATAAFLTRGKGGFDAYRAAYGSAVDTAAAERDAALVHQRAALRTLVALQAVLGALAVGWSLLRARRVEHLLAGPLARLREAVARLGDGDVLTDLPRLGVQELDEVAAALGDLSRDLDHERVSARARAEQTRRVSDQRKRLLATGQAMAACGTTAELARLVTATAADLSGAPAALWVHDDGRLARAAATGEQPDGPDVLVRSAAEDGVRRERDGAVALPLRGAAGTLAVLHVHRHSRLGVRAGVGGSLDVLALTAAAHLQLLRVLEESREQASTDALTGLGNRRRMDEDLAAEFARSTRHGRPLSVALLDLDHFKRVNDTAGHLVGDEWLRLVARAACEQVRRSDRVYRYGGEEVAVVLPETAEPEAAAVLERIRAAVAALRGPDSAPRLTTSAGVAELVPGLAGPADLLRAADTALYAAKRGGRDRVERARLAEALAADPVG